jgi:hypothetical protein
MCTSFNIKNLAKSFKHYEFSILNIFGHLNKQLPLSEQKKWFVELQPLRKATHDRAITANTTQSGGEQNTLATHNPL